MAKKTIKAQMKQRRDTKANWESTNPVLLDGEIGIVTDDPNLYKVGNGSSRWNSLPFRGFDGTVVHETGDSTTAVMSQAAVSAELQALSETIDTNKTETDTKLTELEGEINGYRIDEPTSAIDGSLRGDGVITTDYGLCHVMLDVSKFVGGTIYLYLELSDLQYAFLKSYTSTSAIFCDGKTIEHSYNNKVNNVLIPNDANYMYVLCGSTSSPTLPTSISTSKDSKGITETLSDLESQVNEIDINTQNLKVAVDNLDESKQDKIIRSIDTTDGLVSSSGLDYDNDSYLKTNFVPVEQGDILQFSGSVPNGAACILMYDEYGAYVSKALEGGEFVKEKVTIPDGVKNIRATSRKTSGLELYVYNASVLTNLIYESKDIAGEIINDEYVDTTSGVTGTLSGCARTRMLAVNPKDRIRINAKFSSQIGIAGYDRNMQYSCRVADSSGYNGTVTSAKYAQLVCDNFEIIIPNNVYYIIVSTRDYTNNPIKVTNDVLLKAKIEDIEKAKVIVEPIDNTKFNVYVWSETGKRYLKHTFIHSYYTANLSYVDNDGVTRQKNNVVCSDSWYASQIRDFQDKQIVQGNIQWIYMIDSTQPGFENENLHVGEADHGCAVDLYRKFYLDGKEFDPTAITSPIYGEQLRYIHRAEMYAPNRLVSSSNVDNKPKLDNEGNPIVGCYHFGEALIKSNNVIERHDKLTINRNNTRFAQCFAVASLCMYPYFSNSLVNNEESTWNRWWFDSNDEFNIEKMGGSQENMAAGDWHRYQHSNEIIQWGDGYLCKNYMKSLNHRGKENTSFFYYTYAHNSNGVKIYNSPCYTTEGAYYLGHTEGSTWVGADADVFNKGDVIEVESYREIDVD